MNRPNSIALPAILTLFALCVAHTNVNANTPPLEVFHNGRFLVTSNGTPFFWQGDTNWRLHKLTAPQIITYLNNRKSLGFNVIQGPVLLSPNSTPETRTGTGHANTDPLAPNPHFFQHIDFIFNAANQRGIYMAPVVTWGTNWNAFASPNAAFLFGNYLGQRYRNHNNIIWIVAGEYLFDGNHAHINERWNALAQGLKQGSQNRHLVTIHGSYQYGSHSSSIAFHHSDWLDFNMIQSSHTSNSTPSAANFNLVYADYYQQSPKPTLDSEAHYEDIAGWDAHGVRRRAYWSIFAGAFGHTYGSNGLWQSKRPGDQSETGPAPYWYQAIHLPGAHNMQHLRRLMQSRHMLWRAPDHSALQSPNAQGLSHRILSTRDLAGRYMMLYVPQPALFFTVDMSKVNGPNARAWWFNPRNGKAHHIGVFPATGNRNFMSPAIGPDWVLVIDSNLMLYPPPGIGGPLR